MRLLGAFSVLPATASLLLLGATGSIADNESCKAVVIGVGVVCEGITPVQPVPPSPAPSKSKDSAPAPASPEPAPVSPPKAATPIAPPEAKEVAPAPAPETAETPVDEVAKETVIVKEVVVEPAPVETNQAAPATTDAVAVAPSPSPTSSQSPDQALVISGAPVAESQKSTFIPEFVFDAAPYVTIVSFLALVGMLITARSKKLFPFEGKANKA